MTHPSQSSVDAAKAFIDCTEGDLCERQKLWLEVLKSVTEDLAGGSKPEFPKNKEQGD